MVVLHFLMPKHFSNLQPCCEIENSSQAIMFDEAECTCFYRFQVNQARIMPCQLVHNLDFGH